MIYPLGKRCININVIDIAIVCVLIVNYGRVLSNIVKGAYRNDCKKLLLDLLASYYLGPIVFIAIVWDFMDNIKNDMA